MSNRTPGYQLFQYGEKTLQRSIMSILERKSPFERAKNTDRKNLLSEWNEQYLYRSIKNAVTADIIEE